VHTHKYQGQTLTHDHPGGEQPHEYYQHTEDVSALAELPCSAETDDKYRTSYSTTADYAAYAARRMNYYGAFGGMEDTEAIADGSTLTLEVHQVPVARAVFTAVTDSTEGGEGTSLAQRCPGGIRHGTPMADALAVVDRTQNNGTASASAAWAALRELAEAVRASLTTFSEMDVRALAVSAWELYYQFDSGDLLSKRQDEVIGKAYNVFVRDLP
jgi:hypothetical protein